MAGYAYHVVPFRAGIKPGDAAGAIATQLQQVIDEVTAQGWEFHTFGDVDVNVEPGCLAGLLGAKSYTMSYDMLIFRAPNGS